MFWMKKKDQVLEYRNIKDFSPYKGYYCVIRREGVNLGLFSHYLTNAANIAACIQEGLIPVIDMQNVKNAWNQGDVRKDNPWEYYFKQPMNIGLNQIETDRVLYQNDVVPVPQRPTDSMEFLTNPIAVSYWRTFTKKYMKFSDRVSAYLEETYRNTIKDYRTLGVLCRGTDYVKLRPQEHPIQPETDVIIEKVKETVNQYKYEKIYLTSEDQEICNRFKKEFGNMLIVSSGEKIGESADNYLTQIFEEKGIDIYNNSLDYLAAIYVLSKCNALIAGRTSGSIAAYIMSEGYEYSYFYNLGRYKIHNFMPIRD